MKLWISIAVACLALAVLSWAAAFRLADAHNEVLDRYDAALLEIRDLRDQLAHQAIIIDRYETDMRNGALTYGNN